MGCKFWKCASKVNIRDAECLPGEDSWCDALGARPNEEVQTAVICSSKGDHIDESNRAKTRQERSDQNRATQNETPLPASKCRHWISHAWHDLPWESKQSCSHYLALQIAKWNSFPEAVRCSDFSPWSASVSALDQHQERKFSEWCQNVGQFLMKPDLHVGKHDEKTANEIFKRMSLQTPDHVARHLQKRPYNLLKLLSIVYCELEDATIWAMAVPNKEIATRISAKTWKNLPKEKPTRSWNCVTCFLRLYPFESVVLYHLSASTCMNISAWYKPWLCVSERYLTWLLNIRQLL